MDKLDLIILASHWMEAGCTDPDWCDGADINRDGVVNWLDAVILFGHWNETCP